MTHEWDLTHYNLTKKEVLPPREYPPKKLKGLDSDWEKDFTEWIGTTLVMDTITRPHP